MTTTPATTKPKPRKSAGALARTDAAVPDLAALEQFISDAMEAQQSAISPDAIVKERFTAGLADLEREIAANDDEISLIQRLATSLLQVRAHRKELLERAAARYRKGLADDIEQQERTAA